VRAFIYDKYGYYPQEEFATSFEYQGWFFKIEISEKNDQEIHALRLMLEDLNRHFDKLGSDIILTKDGHYVSSSEYGPVVLVAIKIGEVTLSDLIKMHGIYYNRFNNTLLRISHIRSLWMNKTDVIESRILSTLPLEDLNYRPVYLLGQYALGLAENAIQYLLDTGLDYGDEIINKTLAHKRIDVFNEKFLFNPFNLVVDSPMRDYAELYKNEEISLEQLSTILRGYSITKQDASILLARVIYPSNIFDLLEDYYELKKNIFGKVNKIYSNIDNRELRLKKLHAYLVKVYQIRPISWLK